MKEMSHFTVGVILDDKKDKQEVLNDLEKAMIPFKEYDGEEEVKPYCEWVSVTEKERKFYEKNIFIFADIWVITSLI